MEETLSDQDKTTLLGIARDAVRAAVHQHPFAPSPREESSLNTRSGCFVSLKQDAMLCGCLGNFQSERPLFREVATMAAASASKDPRFPPLRPEDLDRLSIEISVLSPLRRIEFHEEIEIGTHGIYLERNSYRGVLLPQVASEYGWDRETFLNQTCLKAGLPQNAWNHEETDLYIFSAQIFRDAAEA